MNPQYSQLNNPRIINSEVKGDSSKNLLEVQNAQKNNPQPQQYQMNPKQCK